MKSILIFLIAICFCGMNLYAQTPAENRDSIQKIQTELKLAMNKIKKLEAIDSSKFKVSIGGSFNFNQGISATDLYYDLSFYEPNIWSTTEKDKSKRKTGLEFRLYQTLLFSNPVDTSSQITFGNVGLGSAGPDSVLIGDFGFRRTEELDFTDFGVLLRPSYQISKTIFWVGHAEFIFRSTQEKVNYISLDTISVQKILTADAPALRNLPSDRKTTYEDALFYLGTGFNFDLDFKPVFLRIKPIGGVSSLIKSSRFDSVDKRGEGDLRFFYLIEVELVETNSGIKLGVNIRDNDLLKNGNVIDEPRFSIFLSKQFSLNKLAEFIKSK